MEMADLSASKPAALRAWQFDSEHFILDYGDQALDEKIAYRDLVVAIPGPTQDGSSDRVYRLLVVSSQEITGTGDIGNSSGLRYDYEVTSRAIRVLPQPLQEYFVDAIPDHLKVRRPDFHIVVSTKSGNREADSFFRSVVQPILSTIGIIDEFYTVHHTTSDHSVTDLAIQTFGVRAKENAPQTVLLLSGDGGLVDTLNGLLESSRSDNYATPIVGLLALGTGNALANSSGLNRDSSKGLRSFIKGHPHVVPTFKAVFSPGSVILVDEGRRSEELPMSGDGQFLLHGAVVASWGLHASLVADSDTTEYRKYGPERFQMAARELLTPSDGSKPHSYSGRITLFQADDQGQESTIRWAQTEHMYFLATFVSNLERALRISPKSSPLDGQLRLISFGIMASDEVMKIFGLAFDGGKHISHDSVGYDTINGFRINFEECDGHWRRVCIDGKIVSVGRDGWVEVRKDAGSVIELVTEQEDYAV